MPKTWILALGMVAILQFSLWQSRLRMLGVIGIFAAGMSWYQTQRPDILIADRGALVGVMTSEGRAISKPKGAGFVARIWLENDGEKQTKAARMFAGKIKGHHLFSTIGRNDLRRK